MRIVFLIILLLLSEFAYCENEVEAYLIQGYNKDGTFNITKVSSESFPVVEIGIKININNVRLIKILDETNSGGRCLGYYDLRFWMLFKQPINKTTIRAVIKTPCVEKAYDLAKLKVIIITADKKTYFKTVIFKSRWAESDVQIDSH